MDPLQWMGAVRMRVQTADKIITMIHLTRPSVNVLWNKKLHIGKKQIQHILNLYFTNIFTKN